MFKNPELKLVQFTINKVIHNGCVEDVESLLLGRAVNWNAFKELISYHELQPFAHIVFKQYQHLFPDEINKLLFNSYWGSLKNNLYKEKEYNAIYDEFTKQGIKIAPIKGVALIKDVYGDCPVRPMGDIDALIERSDYDASVKVLKDIGYEKDLERLNESYWLDEQCHVVFYKKTGISYPVRLELHFRLDFKRNNKEILPFVWGRTRSTGPAATNTLLLSPEDTIFSLALHQRRFGKMFCLKYALDTALIMNKYKNTFDWEYVNSVCKDYKLSSCLYFLFLQANLLLDRDAVIKEAEKLRVPALKKIIMRKFVLKNIGSVSLNKRVKANYLKSHFLLYDSFTEPVLYILNIPLEQFAKYYNMDTYSAKTKRLYRLRFLYFLIQPFIVKNKS
jgi:hypothetical protein